MEGNQTPNSPIEITKNLSVLCRLGATINGSVVDGVVLKITKAVRISLTSIKFEEGAALLMTSGGLLNVKSCRFKYSYK